MKIAENGNQSVYSFESSDYPQQLEAVRNFQLVSRLLTKADSTFLVLPSNPIKSGPEKGSYDPFILFAFMLASFWSEAGVPRDVQSVTSPYGSSSTDYMQGIAKRFNVVLFKSSESRQTCREILLCVKALRESDWAYIFSCYALIDNLYFAGEPVDYQWVLEFATEAKEIPTLKEYFSHRLGQGKELPTSPETLLSLLVWLGIKAIPGVEEWLDKHGYTQPPNLGVSWETLIMEMKTPEELTKLLDKLRSMPKDLVQQLYSKG